MNYNAKNIIYFYKKGLITRKESLNIADIIREKKKEISRKNYNETRRRNRRDKDGLTLRERQKEESIAIIQNYKKAGLSQRKTSSESGYSIALVKRYWNIEEVHGRSLK